MRLSVRKYVRKDISGYVTCITCIYALYGIWVNVDEYIFVVMRHQKCCMIEFKCELMFDGVKLVNFGPQVSMLILIRLL